MCIFLDKCTPGTRLAGNVGQVRYAKGEPHVVLTFGVT
jgi:hypothetical protein